MIQNLSHRARPLAIAALALSGSCSQLPEPVWPPVREGSIRVVYELPAAGPAAVPAPSSDEHLTILELEVGPEPVTERFYGGRRHFVAPDGVDELWIECRYRLFGEPRAADPFAAVPDIEDRFPGARVLVHEQH